MSLFLICYLVFDLVFVGMARLALNIAPHYLLQVFASIFACGIIASVLTYWTREAYHRPIMCALRLTLSVFVYLTMFMSALLIGATESGLIQRTSMMADFILIIIPGSAIAAVAVYFPAKSKLKQTYLPD